MLDEYQLEDYIIAQLKKQNFTYFNSEEFKDLRCDFETNEPNLREVCVWSHFKEAFKKINKDLPLNETIINKAIKKLNDLTPTNDTDLFKANRQVQKYFIEGMSINDEKEEPHTYQIVDFDEPSNNIFTFTNQLSVSYGSESRRPDLVVYLNGLPLIVWELKKPNLSKKFDEESPLVNAYNQLQNYQEQIRQLFVFNFFNVITNGAISRYGTLFSDYGHFHSWKKIEKNRSIETLDFFINELFNHETLLDLLKNFTFFDKNKDKKVKIIAAYHQYYGVKKTLTNADKSVVNKTHKGGIVFHATGTGKSFMMIFFVKNFINLYPRTTVLVISDRNDLDDQLYANFSSAENFLYQTPKQIEKIPDLVNKLSSINQNGIYFSTVQKFNERIIHKITAKNKAFSLREDILIITDEAHRSHNNLTEKTKLIFDEKNKALKEVSQISYALSLRKCFPNATFVGFSATPIESNDRSTSQVFGDITSVYTMNQAIDDGIVVPLYYQHQHAHLKTSFDLTKQEEFDQQYEAICQEISWKEGEVARRITKNVLDRKLHRLETIIANPQRIEQIARNFKEIYDKRKDVLVGKAMFVCWNRKIAFAFYKKLLELYPELSRIMRLILTTSQQDPEELRKAVYPNLKEAASDFKRVDSDFKIAIVVDMWLTGFDVPSLDLIFIDKPIKLHNLIQAISRVNRVYEGVDKTTGINKIKRAGIIIDYVGISDQLFKAYSMYNTGTFAVQNKKLIMEILPKNIEEEYHKQHVENIQAIYREFFSDLALNFDTPSEEFVSFKKMLNTVSINSKVRDRFLVLVAKLLRENRNFVHLNSSNENRLIRYLECVYIRTRDIILGNISESFVSYLERFRQLVSDSLKFNKFLSTNEKKIDEIVKLRELFNSERKDPIETDDPLAHVKAEYRHELLKKVIDDYAKIDEINSKKFSEQLNELLRRYDQGYITFDEFLEGLATYENLVAKIQEKDDELHLSIKQLLFYKLVNEKSAVTTKKLNHEMSLRIAQEAENCFENALADVDSWYVNGKKIKKFRWEIKQLLNANGFSNEDCEIVAQKYVEKLVDRAFEEKTPWEMKAKTFSEFKI